MTDDLKQRAEQLAARRVVDAEHAEQQAAEWATPPYDRERDGKAASLRCRAADFREDAAMFSDLLSALVQAEQREAAFHMAYRMDCDKISKAALQRAEAAEASLASREADFQSLRAVNGAMSRELGTLRREVDTQEATIRQVAQEMRERACLTSGSLANRHVPTGMSEVLRWADTLQAALTGETTEMKI